MKAWLARSGLDNRFLQLAVFVSLLVWPWLVVTTFLTALLAWRFVLLCQLIALPFSVCGWAIGFQVAFGRGVRPHKAALWAGWVGLIVAEMGLSAVLWPWFGPAAKGPGLWAFPALAVLVTVGVLWLYRAETWQGRPLPEGKMTT
jgi:hypothetical protein